MRRIERRVKLMNELEPGETFMLYARLVLLVSIVIEYNEHDDLLLTWIDSKGLQSGWFASMNRTSVYFVKRERPKAIDPYEW